jgi:hypothetical protein
MGSKKEIWKRSSQKIRFKQKEHKHDPVAHFRGIVFEIYYLCPKSTVKNPPYVPLGQ